MGQDTEKKAYQNHLQTPRINIYEPPFLDLFLVWTIIIYSLSYYLGSSSWRPLDILPWLNLYTVLISEKKSRELSILYNLLYAFFFLLLSKSETSTTNSWKCSSFLFKAADSFPKNLHLLKPKQVEWRGPKIFIENWVYMVCKSWESIKIRFV